MKRAVVLALATVMALCLVGVASAFTPGKPEVDKAAGKFDGQAQPKTTRCVGEDGDPYVQYDGRWAGTMTDTSGGEPRWAASARTCRRCRTR